MQGIKKLLATFILLWTTSTVLYADSISVSLDNDVIFDSDNAYTGGFIINWLSDEYDDTDASGFSRSYIDGYRDIVQMLPWELNEYNYEHGAISLQQSIITPENTQNPNVNYNDLPYVGILNMIFSYYKWDADAFDEYRVVFGTIGPNALGEETQSLVHKITGHDDPQGWDHQLGNSLFAGIGYMHGRKHFETYYDNGTEFELFSSYNIDLGNHFTGFSSGISARYGENVPNQFHTVSTLLGISHNRHLYFEPCRQESGWSVHAGVYFNLIGHMKIIEDADDMGYNINDDRLILTGNIGGDVYWQEWQISFDLFPTKMYTKKERTGSWSRLTITYYY
jgi:hypothetical protein